MAIINHKAPKIKEYPKSLGSKIIFPVRENPFPIIYVDLTHRCNMNCNLCYNPIRTLPDMELSYFEEVCKKLPERVLFRFMGGEPSSHPEFFDFIDVAGKYRHVVSFCTNGTKFADRSFF